MGHATPSPHQRCIFRGRPPDGCCAHPNPDVVRPGQRRGTPRPPVVRLGWRGKRRALGWLGRFVRLFEGGVRVAVQITDFSLDQYRGGNALRVLDLGTALNVALVDNAAGRSQLLQAIPWVLFGPGDYFPESDGTLERVLVPGNRGAATLWTEMGRLEVDREWESAQPDAATGVRLISEDGTEMGVDHLDDMLGRMSPRTYREVFTFDVLRLKRIVRREEYGKSRIRKLAGFLQRRSPQPEALGETGAGDEDGLQALGASIQSLSEWEEAQRELHPAPTPDATASKVTADLKSAEKNLSRGKDKLQELLTQWSRVQSAFSMLSVRARLADVERELAVARKRAKAESRSQVSTDVLRRLDDRLETTKQEYKELRGERDELRRQARDLGNLKRFLQVQSQVDGILMQERVLLREEAAMDQLEVKITDGETALESQRLQSVQDVPAAASTVSPAAVRVDAMGERLQETQRDVTIAEERLDRAESSGRATAETLARASAYVTHPEEAVALHEAEERLARLRDLAGQDDQRQDLELEQESLQETVRRLYGRQLMPFRAVLALGVPFMIGVAMIIYGLVLQRGNTDWRLVVLGFGAALTSALIKVSADRGTSEVLQSARRRLSRVQRTLDDLSASDNSLVRPGVSLTRQIEDAERDVARLETKFASREHPTGRSQELVRETSSIESARLQLTDARRRAEELQQQWRELMMELELSPNLTPEHARDVLREREVHAAPRHDESRSLQLELQLQQWRGELQRRREWLSGITQQARQLAKDLGYASANTSVTDALEVLREAVAEFKQRVQSRKQIQRSLQRLDQKRRRVRDAGRRVAEQKKQLLDERRRQTEMNKLEAKANADRLRALEKQRDAWKRELADSRQNLAADDGTDWSSLSEEELHERLDQIATRIRQLLERLIGLSEQRGRLRALSAAEKKDATPSADWEHLRVQTETLQQNWESLRERRASTHVPGVTRRFRFLENASEHLRVLSGGQLVEILTVGDPARDPTTADDASQAYFDVLLAERDGSQMRLEDVRREHFANLYFSLWLARLECYASRGARLPVVMEDPLAATDATRRSEVAQLLIDFARQGHQVMLVTAEPLTADLFAHLEVPIADLSRRETVAREAWEPPADPSGDWEPPSDPPRWDAGDEPFGDPEPRFS